MKKLLLALLLTVVFALATAYSQTFQGGDLNGPPLHDPFAEQWTYLKYIGVAFIVLIIPENKKGNLNSFYLILSIITFIVSGIWGLALTLTIVAEVFGKIIAFISLLVFPIVLAVAPVYTAFIDNNYLPVTVIYGGLLAGFIFLKKAEKI
jgi:hypothetical protein